MKGSDEGGPLLREREKQRSRRGDKVGNGGGEVTVKDEYEGGEQEGDGPVMEIVE